MNKIMDWKTLSATTVVIASTLALGACGGSSDGSTAAAPATGSAAAEASQTAAASGGGAASGLDADQQAVADAIATQLETAPGALTTADETQCWANGMVSTMGVDRLAELGITADSATGVTQMAGLGLTDADATAVTDSLFSCIDVKAVMQKQLESTQGSSEIAACVADNLDENVLKDFISTSITGKIPGAETTQLLAEAGAGCANG